MSTMLSNGFVAQLSMVESYFRAPAIWEDALRAPAVSCCRASSNDHRKRLARQTRIARAILSPPFHRSLNNSSSATFRSVCSDFSATFRSVCPRKTARPSTAIAKLLSPVVFIIVVRRPFLTVEGPTLIVIRFPPPIRPGNSRDP